MRSVGLFTLGSSMCLAHVASHLLRLAMIFNNSFSVNKNAIFQRRHLTRCVGVISVDVVTAKWIQHCAVPGWSPTPVLSELMHR
jgi:hypothetical protein